MCENSNHLWSNGRRRQNNIQGTDSEDSTDDNLDVPGTKIPQRQRSLSMVKPVLEEILKKIASLETQLEQSTDNGKKTASRSNSDTSPKVPYTPQNNLGYTRRRDSASDGSGIDNVISRPLQVGNGNFMVVCENVTSRSERQRRQVGDKNVIINVNSCCNKCQILDHTSNQVVPVDSDGEIWLEIKRRSLTDHTREGVNRTYTDLPSSPTSPRPGEYNIPAGGLNNLSRTTQTSAKYISHARPGDAIRTPVQHTDRSPFNTDEGTFHFNNINVERDSDQHHIYDRIVEHPGGRLSVKIPIPMEHEDSSDFTRQHLARFLETDSVTQYLSAGGESFELSVCTWSYEKEEVYSNGPLDDSDADKLYSLVDKPPTEVAPLPPPPPPPISTRSQDDRQWFKETMDKKEAHDHLKNKENGSFLVRRATQPDQKHRYTIEFVDQAKIRRLKILRSEDGYHFEYSENKTFDSLDNLIRAIRMGGLEIKEDSGVWKKIDVFPV